MGAGEVCCNYSSRLGCRSGETSEAVLFETNFSSPPLPFLNGCGLALSTNDEQAEQHTKKKVSS